MDPCVDKIRSFRQRTHNARTINRWKRRIRNEKWSEQEKAKYDNTKSRIIREDLKVP
jgi:ribosomal protein S21